MTSKTNAPGDKDCFEKETLPDGGSLRRHSWRTPVVMDLDYRETEGKGGDPNDGEYGDS